MSSKIFSTRKGQHIWHKRTICEVHREIYDLLVLGKHDEILPKLEEAYQLGIKMTAKLVEYKLSLPKWAENNDEEAARLRKLRVELETRHSLRP